MFLKSNTELAIRICLLFANISNFSYARDSIFWPWNIFRKKVDHYDKDVESKAKLRTEEWIKKANLPCDIHEVITEDGYILVLYRIPKAGYQPVLLVHGMLTSSLSFVMMGPENSLAFQLASSDFDVWLINTRGTVQSRNHTTISRKDPLYWNFSFHQIGLYDISATIDKIRNITAFHQIIYIGHSQGATALFALCSLRPEYNDRILLMQALAPVVYLRNISSVSQNTIKEVKRFVKEKTKSKSFEIFAQGDLLRKCSVKTSNHEDCLQFMTDVLGPGQYNQSLDPIVLGTAFAGGSIQEIEHFLQISKSGDFVAYDYGLEGNQQRYNHVEPTTYNLSKITMPIILHYGRTDATASPKAVHRLYKALSGVMGVYAVDGARFSHYDFIWSPSLKSLLNTNVVKLCDDFLKGVLKYRIE